MNSAKWTLVLVSSLIAAAAICMTVYAQRRQPRETCYYTQSNGKIDLDVSTDKIAIRFGDGVNAARQAAIIANEQVLDSARSLVELRHSRAFLVGIRLGTTPATVQNALDRLSVINEVYYASPIVYTNPDFPMTFGNRFYVSVPASVPDSRVEALCAQRNVQLAEKIDYGRLGRKGYYFYTSRVSGLDAMAMANTFYTTLGALGASPSFTALYDIGASNDPNDSYFNHRAIDPCPEGEGEGEGYYRHCNFVSSQTQENTLQQIGVIDAWYNYQCYGDPRIVVAVLDKGVDMKYPAYGVAEANAGHPDLNPNQWTTDCTAGEGEADCVCDGEGEGEASNCKIYGHDYIETAGEGEGEYEDPIPMDDGDDPDGHGTFVAGVIGAQANNGIGIAGIVGGWYCEGEGEGQCVPQEGCKIMPVRVYSYHPEYYGTETPLEPVGHGILWAADNGANVINMSLGAYDDIPDWWDSVAYARYVKDCVLVAASHNYDHGDTNNPRGGPGCTYPAAYGEVIAVGALNQCDCNTNDPLDHDGDCRSYTGSSFTGFRKYGGHTQSGWNGDDWPEGNPDNGYPATYGCEGEGEGECRLVWGSDYGNTLDLMAPGINVWTTDLMGDLGGNHGPEDGTHLTADYEIWHSPGTLTDDCWHLFHHTSAATPQVAAIAAMLMSKNLKMGNPPLSAPEVQAILEFSADDLQYEARNSRNDPPVEEYEVAGYGRDIYTGYGRVNAKKALDLLTKGRFVIRDPNGRHVASFDSEGNLVADAIFWANAGYLLDPDYFGEPDGNFFIMNGATYLFRSMQEPWEGPWEEDPLSRGGVLFAGGLFERVSYDLDDPAVGSAFRIRFNGHTVAAVNAQEFQAPAGEGEGEGEPETVPAGSLLLKGRAFEGWTFSSSIGPDRVDSQGN